MREIKFRAKDTLERNWYVGSYMFTDDNKNDPFRRRPFKESHRIIFYSSGDWNMGGWCDVEIDPSTLGQFTGFKDMNDKEIYEGDIIRDFHSFYFSGNFTKKIRGAYDVTQDKDEPIPVVSYFRNYAVEWGRRGSYILRNGSDQHPLCTRFRGVEVIGNIYDNPELLTK